MAVVLKKPKTIPMLPMPSHPAQTEAQLIRFEHATQPDRHWAGWYQWTRRSRQIQLTTLSTFNACIKRKGPLPDAGQSEGRGLTCKVGGDRLSHR